MIPLVSVCADLSPNRISDNPTNAKPKRMVKMPAHITFRTVEPKNATERSAVKMMTAPGKKMKYTVDSVYNTMQGSWKIIHYIHHSLYP